MVLITLLTKSHDPLSVWVVITGDLGVDCFRRQLEFALITAHVSTSSIVLPLRPSLIATATARTTTTASTAATTTPAPAPATATATATATAAAAEDPATVPATPTYFCFFYDDNCYVDNC